MISGHGQLSRVQNRDHRLGVVGYVFDGADGSQMAFWTCYQTTRSAAHVHDYDEYMIVVRGLLCADSSMASAFRSTPGTST